MKKLTATLPFILLCGLSAFGVDPARPREFPLPGHGAIALTVPADWKDHLAQPPGERPPTITFTPARGPRFKVLITPLWRAKDGEPLPDLAAIRKLVRQSADAVQTSAENPLNLSELRGESVDGFYFLAVDSAPKPGGFKFVTSGTLRLDDLLLFFVISSNDEQSAVEMSALKALMHATRKTPAADARP